MYIKGSPVEIQTLVHVEPDRPQYDRPTAYVIAQHYSSTTFVSLRFHCRVEVPHISKILLLQVFILVFFSIE
jgi:hypothetical protein